MIHLIPFIPMEVPITDVINSAITDTGNVIKAALTVVIIGVIAIGTLKSGFSLGKFVALLLTGALIIWALMFDGIVTVAESISAYVNSKTEK